MANNTKSERGWYGEVFKGWRKGELGDQPTEAHLTIAHVFGRPGKQSMAVAMALRDAGVTGNQIKLAAALFDGKATPQLNHMKAQIAAGAFKREPVTGAYKLTLTPKGQQWVDKAAAAKAVTDAPVAEPVTKAKPVKAKTAKARKPKADAELPATAQAAPEGVPAESAPMGSPEANTAIHA